MPLAPRSRARLQATIAGAGDIPLRWRAHHEFTIAVAVLTTGLAVLALPGYYATVQRSFDCLTQALVSALRAIQFPENFVLQEFIRTLISAHPISAGERKLAFQENST